MKFFIHRFEIVRMKVGPIEADSMKEAINKSEELVNIHEYFRDNNPSDEYIIHAESTDECDCFCVDVVGDEEYEHTKWFGKDGRTELIIGRK